MSEYAHGIVNRIDPDQDGPLIWVLGTSVFTPSNRNRLAQLGRLAQLQLC